MVSYQGLSDWEIKMLSVADLPPSLRDETLFPSLASSSDGSPLYSLNNEPGSAPLFGLKKSGLWHCPEVCGESPEAWDRPGHVRGACSLLARHDKDWAPAQKRDLMEHYLREWLPGLTWSTDLWRFVESFKLAAVDVFGIESTSSQPFRVHNYLACYSKGAHGWTYTNTEQVDDVYRQRFRCREVGCLDCRDLQRGLLAAEWLGVWKKIVENKPGCPGLLEVVFTLPEELEALPLENGELAKRIENGVHEILRDLFGVGTVRGRRSNLLCHFSTHAVGDRDLFRDRYHVHVDVLPCHIKQGDDGERVFEWLGPARIATGHTAVDWKIDLVWLRDRFNALLKKVFGSGCPDAIFPQVAFVSYSDKSWRYKKRVEEKERIFWGIAAHKLKYAMRGFGRDVEKAVLRSDAGAGLCVLKCERDGLIGWQVAPIGAVADRYQWLRKKNVVRTRGFGRRLKEYAEVLGLADEVGEGLPDVLKAEAEVRILREKRFDRVSRKVKWVRDEVYKWVCPVTGKKLEKSKRELKPWKGG